MNKHTQGPWTVTRDGEISIREETGRRRLIAHVFALYGDVADGFRQRIDGSDDANARLIAAAPDLLAAARALLDDIDDDGPVLQFHFTLIDAIKRAVRRAEEGK